MAWNPNCRSRTGFNVIQEQGSRWKFFLIQLGFLGEDLYFTRSISCHNHNNDPLDPSPLPFSHIKQQFSGLKLPANKHPVVSFHPTHPTIATSSFSSPHALSLNAPLASSFQAFFIVSSSSSPLRRPATPLPRRNPTSRTTTATTTTRDDDNDAWAGW